MGGFGPLIELAPCLANATGPVPLVLDLRIAHDRWGSGSNPNLNGHLHYPTDIHRTLYETTSDKILQYRVDYSIVPLTLFPYVSYVYVWCYPHNSNRKWTTFSSRLRHRG